MPVLKSDNAPITVIKEGVQRKLIHAKNLMTVVIDFDNGPWDQPDPRHDHVHEQTTYVVSGEILFFCEAEEPQHLKAGDLFWVPSGQSHTIQLLTKHVRLVDSFNPIREEFL